MISAVYHIVDKKANHITKYGEWTKDENCRFTFQKKDGTIADTTQKEKEAMECVRSEKEFGILF